MRRTLMAVAFVTALLVSPTSPSARAHSGHSKDRVVVTAITPDVDGVKVSSVPSVAGKLVLESPRHTTTVIGIAGQAVFRVGPQGVEANMASPEWFRMNEPLGIAFIPKTATPDGVENWRRVAVAPRWEWFDHRLHPATGSVTAWDIPIDVDGARHRVTGTIEEATTRFSVEIDPKTVPSQLRVSAVDTPRPALTVAATTKEPVLIVGQFGETFARLTATTSEVNVHSPMWVSSAQLANRDLLAALVDPALDPEFVTFRPASEVTYPDARLLPPEGQTQVAWRIPVIIPPALEPVFIEGVTLTSAAVDEAALQPRGAETGERGMSSRVPIVVMMLLAVGGLVALAYRWRMRATGRL